jgi:hypothetical protein
LRGKRGDKPRGFRLLLLPAGPNDYGVELEETNGGGDDARVVVRASADHARRVMPALLDAVRESGHPKTILATQRRAPIGLTEEAGVRLGLVLLATDPVTKSRRIEDMADGVASMSGEETYYWYAKVTGPTGRRLQRSLRLFLAEE